MISILHTAHKRISSDRDLLFFGLCPTLEAATEGDPYNSKALEKSGERGATCSADCRYLNHHVICETVAVHVDGPN